MRCSSLIFAVAAMSASLGPAASGAGSPLTRPSAARTNPTHGASAGASCEHGAPSRGGAGAVAVLLVGETEKIARLGLVRIARHGGFKNVLGLIGHDAVGGGDQGLAEIGIARRGFAVERERLAPRHDRVVEAAEPQIDRSDHLPAVAVIGAFCQMRFDLADQRVDRLVAGRCLDAGEGRLPRNIRRAEHEVKT